MFPHLIATILPITLFLVAIWFLILSVLLFTQRIFIKKIIQDDPAEMKFSGVFHGLANTILIGLSMTLAISLTVGALVIYPLISFYSLDGSTEVAKGVPSRSAPKVAKGVPSRTDPKKTGSVGFTTIIIEGASEFEGIAAGDPRCTREFIISKLGPPQSERERWLSYGRQYGLDFWMSKDIEMIGEIRLNRGFRGKLNSGISLSSTMEDVFGVYGNPDSEKTVDDFQGHYGNRTLYKSGTRNKIFYNENGLLFWFNGDRINQIVAFGSAKFAAESDLAMGK